MKRTKRCFPFLLAATLAFAGASAALADDDIAAHTSCAVCRMDRQKFDYSRVLLEFADGTTVGTCSIHCATVYMSDHRETKPKSIRVADYNTRKLIQADKAFWVIGGRKQGVMTRQAKWAFEEKSAAKAFIRECGGNLVTFDQILKASYAFRGSPNAIL